MQKSTHLIILGLFLVGGASAQATGVTLGKVRATFSKADTNGDALLSRAEAAAAGIPSRDMQRMDADKSGSLSGEEFIVYYSQLLSRAGRSSAKDLEAEVKRINAARRAAQQKKDQDRKDKARADKKANDQARIDQARADKKASDQARIDQARADKEANDQARIDQARADKKASDQARIDQARADKKADDQARIDQARADKKASDQARIDAVRAKKEAKDQTGNDAGKGTPEPVQAPMSDSDRAAKLLRAAVASGRVTKAAAKDVFDLLTNTTLPTKVEELRRLHQVATARVSALAKSGSLSPTEARELHKALTRRMQQAGVKPSPPVQTPSAKPPVRRKPGGNGPAPQARRKPNTPASKPPVGDGRKPADGSSRKKAPAKKPAVRPSEKGGSNGGR
ncbi:MAG: hypothetical protein CMJ86_08790 [Planctomycetes bacterium]|nr:hypothetical protein [Planctomycetota bacterium]